jgi:ryanodine receptor 2
MFKKEETNFVSANDIDNMLLIMPNKNAGQPGGPLDTSAKISKEISNNSNESGNKKGKKKNKKTGSPEKKFTSLIVAGLKRLIQIGINFFEGKEQELIQMAKQKFIDIKMGNNLEAFVSPGSSSSSLAKVKAISQNAGGGNQDDGDNLELTKDQEDLVIDFMQKYIRSIDKLGTTIESKDQPGQIIEVYQENEAMDKETYLKTKWQRTLYRKITSKRHLLTTMQNLSQNEIIKRMSDLAKVLYGLHMVEHPQMKSKGIWRKLMSGQRKKAVMACFRMAPLYSIPLHRAINLFLKAYKQKWLDNPESIDPDIMSLIPDLCPEVEGGEAGGEAADLPAVEAGGSKSEEGSSGSNGASPNSSSDIFDASSVPDPLRQLITSFNRAATTEQTAGGGGGSVMNNLANDQLYMIYAEAMSKSIEIIDDDDDEEGGDGGGEPEEDQTNVFEETEMIKQKLLYEQGRLAERGAAEMCLLYISASKGEKTEMLEKTLQLGISLLHGGNVEVQQRMLNHLKDKKDVGFFTSLAGLMASCTVLDLDTFERCIKAEQFGGLSSSDDGMAGKKNLHDADFTCSIFRFLQLLCEGHNLEFQNYLRAQTGNNTTVNTIICTVDYLLRLQESIMDFYWHYSGKSTVDVAGKENFCRAITVAKQVFNSLTEYIQGPCVGNQLTLAHSRLWDAIGGFLYIFANLQDKLSKDPHQIELLRELMTLQKDMIVMLLSMLEGNVLNGPIGKQMVDTLIENQQNVEMLLKFFDIFLKMKDITTSDAFQEFDTNKDGWISPKEFRKAMEAQKMYSLEEIDYILMCVDTNQDGKIDFKEFTERFHDPAKDIGFNMAVLLTNLSEHMSHDARLDRLMKKASSFLSYFEPFLGRIEIQGSSGRIERVYFEIKESNIEQWNKPQIKESKRQFLFDSVNEGDDKEKLEVFVNFCEDSIFEMQHAASISSSSDEEGGPGAGDQSQSLLRNIFDKTKNYLTMAISLLSPSHIQNGFNKVRSMEKKELFNMVINMNINIVYFIFYFIYYVLTLMVRSLYYMVTGNSLTTGIPTANIQDEHHHDAQTTPTFIPFGLSNLENQQQRQQQSDILDETMSEQQGEMHHYTDQNLDETQRTLNTELELYDSSANQNASGGALPDLQNNSNENFTSQSVSSSLGAQQTKSKYASSVSGSIEEEDDATLAQKEGAESQSATSSSNSNYKKILSMFARNFYKLKYLALILAFLINFLMLFYKARTLSQDSPEADLFKGSVGAEVLDTGDEGEEQLIEVIMMDPEEYYIEHFLKMLAFIHSLVSFALMVAYYILKIPLVIFKREKEIARKIEFQGMWIAEQPSDDDLRSHWDKIVLSTRTYPEMYWDKFIKKKVKAKYADQYDLDQLCKLLGISADSDQYKSDSNKSKSAAKSQSTDLMAKLKSFDWSYQIWKWGVILTDNVKFRVIFYFEKSAVFK